MLLKNQRGQSLIEYMVIVAMMGVASMGVIRILSKTTNVQLAKITQSLRGGKSNVRLEFERIEESDVRKKDMSNFFNGARDNRKK